MFSIDKGYRQYTFSVAPFLHLDKALLNNVFPENALHLAREPGIILKLLGEDVGGNLASHDKFVRVSNTRRSQASCSVMSTLRPPWVWRGIRMHALKTIADSLFTAREASPSAVLLSLKLFPLRIPLRWLGRATIWAQPASDSRKVALLPLSSAPSLPAPSLQPWNS